MVARTDLLKGELCILAKCVVFVPDALTGLCMSLLVKVEWLETGSLVSTEELSVFQEYESAWQVTSACEKKLEAPFQTLMHSHLLITFYFHSLLLVLSKS